MTIPFDVKPFANVANKAVTPMLAFEVTLALIAFAFFCERFFCDLFL
jgi:hypothetical protein